MKLQKGLRNWGCEIKRLGFRVVCLDKFGDVGSVKLPVLFVLVLGGCSQSVELTGCASHADQAARLM